MLSAVVAVRRQARTGQLSCDDVTGVAAHRVEASSVGPGPGKVVVQSARPAPGSVPMTVCRVVDRFWPFTMTTCRAAAESPPRPHTHRCRRAFGFRPRPFATVSPEDRMRSCRYDAYYRDATYDSADSWHQTAELARLHSELDGHGCTASLAAMDGINAFVTLLLFCKANPP